MDGVIARNSAFNNTLNDSQPHNIPMGAQRVPDNYIHQISSQ